MAQEVKPTFLDNVYVRAGNILLMLGLASGAILEFGSLRTEFREGDARQGASLTVVQHDVSRVQTDVAALREKSGGWVTRAEVDVLIEAKLAAYQATVRKIVTTDAPWLRDKATVDHRLGKLEEAVKKE